MADTVVPGLTIVPANEAGTARGALDLELNAGLGSMFAYAGFTEMSQPTVRTLAKSSARNLDDVDHQWQ